MPAHVGLGPVRRLRARPRRASSSGGCATPASCSSARRTCPSSGSCRSPSRAASARPATRGTPTAPGRLVRAAAAAVASGMVPSRTAATAAARSGSRRRAAASWAQAERAGASRAARPGRRLPRPGRRAQPDGRGDRRAARRARGLRDRRRHLGAAAGRAVRGPPRASRAGSGSGSRPRPPSRPSSTRSASRPMSDAAELLASLGHEVEESAAPWRSRTRAGCSRSCSGRRCRWASASAALPSAASRPRSSWSRSRGRSGTASASAARSTTWLARTSSPPLARPIVALWDDFDVVLTPALAERPVRIGEVDTCSAEPWEDFRRSGRFTPYTAIFNVTGQPAISLPLFHGDDGLPTAVQLAGRPPARPRCSRWPPSSRRRGRGRTAGRSRRRRRRPRAVTPPVERRGRGAECRPHPGLERTVRDPRP